MNKLYVLALGLLLPLLAFAQRTVTGTVVDEYGEPLIGAAVRVQGTTSGTITDFDGAFSLPDVAADATVEISYMGYLPQQLKAADGMRVVLMEDVQKLEDVIVVGYGAAKIKDLTSPIDVVKGEQLIAVPTSSPMSALQGKVAGVNITNSGAPGSGPTVQIRGIGSFSNNTPLFVVDGMFYDNINFLNNGDIEDMSIMKDASAAAIYGVRAANGVVIITTKRGKQNQRPDVTYDGYVGVQTVSNLIDMCSSDQYAEMLLEVNRRSYTRMFNKSMTLYGGTYDAENGVFHLNQNTNWYKELLRPAVITNHSLTINGGSDKATYGVGMSYLYQNGIMNTPNDYNRMNIRGNLEYKPFKWLTVGFNGIFVQSQQQFPNNAAWQQAYNMPGIFPVYDPTTADLYTDGFASPLTLQLTSNFYNPVATAKYYDSRNYNNQMMASVFAQFNIIPDKLNLRTSYNYDYTGMEAVTFIPEYYISNNQKNETSNLTKSTTSFNNWIWDNTLTYSDQWGKHGFKAMLGLSLREERYRNLWAVAQDVPAGKDSYKYISLGNTEGRVTGDDGSRYRGFSYFGRLNYNYDDRYMVMFTIRRDGSSKYNEKWGTFPSVGAAWVLSNEEWLKGVEGVDYLKLRASWGLLGNDKIGASFGTTSSNVTRAVFGTNTALSGYINSTNFSWLSWEVVNETNVGTSFGFFGNRLTGDIDWYYRLTQNAVVSPTLPMQEESIAGNWGEILNMGVDINLNWEHHVGKDWTYFIGGNVSWLHNRVMSLRDGVNIIKGGKTVQMVGEKMNSYYGFKVVGIYQTDEECAADPIAVANGLVPGDFKYEDVNNDNIINESDKQILGSYIPDWIYGLNMGFRYKGLDLNIVFSGKAGGELWNRKRALRYASNTYNFDLDQYTRRWHGEGTSNTDPSAAGLMKSWNIGDSQNASYFVESADYFRIQNITLGYTFTNVGAGEYKMPSIRLSLSAEKPFTAYTAHALTPEVSDPEGWDTEVYPLTSTWSFAVQLKF
ncbi:MAG: TonB-dependent receptor [Paludibacteraceae bacterium]|nr:TonB-dependent receptor [Paludibacteraceae bacterium]